MNEKNNDGLDRLVDNIIASYHADERTERIGHAFLPSRDGIVRILGEVCPLLFPGFFGDKELTEENLKYHVGNLLVHLGEDLADQIRYCLCAAAGGKPPADHSQSQLQADKLAHEFMDRIPKIREMLVLDVQAAYDGDPAAKSIDEVIYCYPGFFAITVYRVSHELIELGVPLMPRIMCEHAHSITGADIHPGATIGKSFFIDHATGVVIGETTEIGDNVKIYQGVTLGAPSFPKDERGRVIKGHKRHPTIEDNVTIYANATILGGKTVIGKGATVSGNTVVLRSITADSVVAQENHGLNVRSKQAGS